MRLVLAVSVALALSLSRGAVLEPPAYTALGGGHLLRDVSKDGRWLTLEDKSRWDVHPRDRFQTVDWEADASIAVRTTRGEDGFDYEVVNTSADEGVLAKFTPPR